LQSALILPNHPRINRTPSSDSGVVVTSGGGSADPFRTTIAKEEEVVSPQENSQPPNALSPMQRNLPARPKQPIYSSLNKEKKVEDAKSGQEETKSSDLDSKELRKTTVKNIYDFERYVAYQSRQQTRPTSMPPCNPVMQPNYLRNIPSNSVLERQLFLEQQRQQQDQHPDSTPTHRNAQSTYMNWNPLSESTTVPPPGAKDYIYENYVVAQQNYEQQRRRSNSQQHNYVNVALHAAGGQMAPRSIQRQHALDQQDASDQSK